MNKLLLTSIEIILLTPAFSQDVSLKLFVEDPAGRKDTVVFGQNDTSTLGIDTLFGEFNLFGTPFDSLDIRVIQRDSANFNCIRESFYSSTEINLYFPENIDSRTDFRPFGSFQSVYNNFEIYIYSINYPVTIRSDFSGIAGSYLEGYSVIHLLNSDCDEIDSTPINYSTVSDPLFVLNDSSFNTLVVNFQHEVGIEEMDILENTITIFPNPANEIVSVKLNNVNFSNPLCTILNVLGQQMLTTKLSLQNHISLSNLVSGIYILRISDNKKTVQQSFIKE